MTNAPAPSSSSRVVLSEALIEASVDGLIAVDQKGTVVVFNAAAGRIFGVDPKVMLDGTLEGMFAPELFATHQVHIARFFSGQGSLRRVPVETMAWNLCEKRPVPVEITLSEADVLGERILLASIRDTTRRVEARRRESALQAQLSQAQKMEAVGTLAAGLAHDFNNLLGTVYGYASSMSAELEGSERHKRDLGQILHAVKRARDLVEKLLAFSRQSEPRRELFSANRVVRDVVALLRRTFPARVRMSTSLAKKVTVIGDQVQLEQAVINLCINSRDALGEGGEIKIQTSTVELDGERARAVGVEPATFGMISVVDNGTGMDSATAARAFDPFFTTKAKGEGTGLGLTLVRSALLSQGGGVRLESQPGAGTTVALYLPAGAPPELPGRLEGSTRTGAGETILVVDDEGNLREMLKRLLEGIGYQVLLAESGEDALGIYEEEGTRIDLVILDVVLVGISGEETLEGLQELNPAVKVIVSTGFARNEEEPRRLLEKGALGFLKKPYGLIEASRAIRDALDGAADRKGSG
jgi:two-component system, cell cycle sensor histidine kinase and response regulator CckA